MFCNELMFTGRKINSLGDFSFILCKPLFTPVTLFVNFGYIFKSLDWWPKLELSDVWEVSSSVILSTELGNAFLSFLEPVIFSTHLKDTFKWTLSKLTSALLSASKEPLFLDVMPEFTVLRVDLDVSSKNRYLYCKNYLL